jgi:hypothetical protein
MQLLLKFMWEETSTADLQTELHTLFTSNAWVLTPILVTKFSPFFAAPVGSEAEQAAAKTMICDLLGLVTQKRDPNRPTLEEGVRFQHEVEVSDKKWSFRRSKFPSPVIYN